MTKSRTTTLIPAVVVAAAAYMPGTSLASSCLLDPDLGLYKVTTVMPISGEEIVFTSYDHIKDKYIVERVEESAKELHKNALESMAKSVRERFAKTVLERSGAPSPGLRKRAAQASKGGG